MTREQVKWNAVYSSDTLLLCTRNWHNCTLQTRMLILVTIWREITPNGTNYCSRWLLNRSAQRRPRNLSSRTMCPARACLVSKQRRGWGNPRGHVTRCSAEINDRVPVQGQSLSVTGTRRRPRRNRKEGRHLSKVSDSNLSMFYHLGYFGHWLHAVFSSSHRLCKWCGGLSLYCIH